MSNKPEEQSQEPLETSGTPARAAGPGKTLVREYTEAILIALVLALLIRTFVVQAFKIPSGSMEPTLLIGDHLLVSKFSYGIHIPNEILFTSIQLFPDYHFFTKVPERGDIVVFKYPEDPSKDFIKRVVGLPGETLQVIDQRVYINDKLLKEPYAHHTQLPSLQAGARDNLPPLRIPEDSIFVMGDNRENSHDSRMWGTLKMSNLRGKAQWIYWSWDSTHSGVRTDRLGNSVYRLPEK